MPADVTISTRGLRRDRLPVTRRLALSALFFVSVIMVGTIGYVAFEGAGAGDAFYLTIITVFAVGYAETIPLDASGRAFTVVLIVLGIGGYTFLTVTIFEFLVEGHLLDLVGRRRMARRLAGLDNHLIVCGFGRVGRQVADDLSIAGTPHVIIDINPERLALAHDRGLPYVEGNATTEPVLRAAGLERARGLATCTDDDATNVLVALTAKLRRPDMFVAVRIKDPENASKAVQAGADRVIAPAEIGGHRIAALLTKPHVVDFLDVVTHGSDVDLVLEEIHLHEGSPLVDRTLADAGLRERFGVNVVAIRRAGAATTTTHPDAHTALHTGDVLVVMGSREDLDRLARATQPR